MKWVKEIQNKRSTAQECSQASQVGFYAGRAGVNNIRFDDVELPQVDQVRHEAAPQIWIGLQVLGLLSSKVDTSLAHLCV